MAAVLVVGCAGAQRSKEGLAVPFGPAGLTDQAVRPLRHALLVGIDEFQDARFQPLYHATADARAMGEALTDFEDVRVLDTPAQTTRSAILAELAALERRVRTARDTVVLYFSTHGSLGQEPGGELKRVLVASDTLMDLPLETGISVDALARKADAFPSRRNLLVLATCHSGRGKSQLPDELARALAAHKGQAPPLLEVSEAVIVLTAASFGETAREDDALGHDVYTWFLLRALDEGDRDGDGAVTATEAHDYARENTYAHTGGQQRPTSESSVLGRDPIVLRGWPVRVGRPVVYSYAPSSEGVAVQVNGVHKGTLPGGIALQPGSYRLRLATARDGRVLYEGNVDVHAGEYVDLSRLVPRAMQFAAQIGVGALIPLSSSARQVLPTMPLALARASVRHFQRDWLRFELEAALMTGSGEDVTIPATRAPFRVSGANLSLGAGAEASLPAGFSVATGLGLGTLFLSRDYQGVYSGHQSLRATTGTLYVEGGWSPTDRLRFDTRLTTMAILGNLASSNGPHLALMPVVQSTFSF